MGSGQSVSPEVNGALVFIKPHAQTPAVQALVRTALEEQHIKIIAEGQIDAAEIDGKRLIDQHYYAIASKATLMEPSQLPVPVEKFRDAFGEDWSTVLAEDRAVNAMEAGRRFGLDADALEKEWRKCEPAGLVTKFGGGFYCGKMNVGGQELYVFNAFFMSMRSQFTAPGASIHYFSVAFDPALCPWAKFRAEVLGPTDPAAAPENSIRRSILDGYADLGLAAAPNKGENGVHASASPFEGLAERMNWLEADPTTDPFGAALIQGGISVERVREWALDPRVVVGEDQSQASVFDTLEDMDAAECVEKLLQLNALNAPKEGEATETTAADLPAATAAPDDVVVTSSGAAPTGGDSTTTCEEA